MCEGEGSFGAVWGDVESVVVQEVWNGVRGCEREWSGLGCVGRCDELVRG